MNEDPADLFGERAVRIGPTTERIMGPDGRIKHERPIAPDKCPHCGHNVLQEMATVIKHIGWACVRCGKFA